MSLSDSPLARVRSIVEVYDIDIHEVEGLADWVGGCRGGILGVEGGIPYLIRHWPMFVL